MSKKRWSEEEVALLREIGPTTDMFTIAERLGRTHKSVHRKMFDAGIKGRRASGVEGDLLRPEKREEHRARQRELTGDKNPSWKGNTRGQYWYGLTFWESAKPTVLLRDNGMCQEPGCGQPGDKVHHIVRFRICEDNDTRNLVTLCNPHHRVQPAHGWHQTSWDSNPEGMIGTLPEYQRNVLDGYVPKHLDKIVGKPKRKTVDEREAELMERFKDDTEIARCRRQHPYSSDNTMLSGSRKLQDCRICNIRMQKSSRIRRGQKSAVPAP